MKKKFYGFTAEENTAMNNAQRLVKRSMQDDTSLEVFNLALENCNQVVAIAIAARRARITKKNLVQRIFNK